MNGGQQKPPVILETPRPHKHRVLHLFLLCLCAGVVWFIAARGCNHSATADVRQLLAGAKLAPLPPSATNLAYHQWGRLFSHETFVRFRLSPADLNAFISNSPSLHGLEPEFYNSEHQHLPYLASDAGRRPKDHDYFHKHPDSPPWFDMSVRGKGRKYILYWGPGMWVVIDEDNRIVWLNVGK